MKLKLLKPIGALAAGETHRTETDAQGEALINGGFAESDDSEDEETVRLKRELYKDEFGNWRTREVPIEEGEEHFAIPLPGDNIISQGEINSTQSMAKKAGRPKKAETEGETKSDSKEDEK